MTDMSPNDRAYITISKELLCLRNDLAALEKLGSIVGSLNGNYRESLKDFRGDRVHSEEWQGLSRAIELMSDTTEMHGKIKKMRERVLALELLCEAYVKGKDIVQTRLAQD